MSLLGMFTASIRKAVSDAVVSGVADGVKRVLEGAEPAANATGEVEAATTLLLAWQPTQTEEDTPQKRRGKAAAG